MAESKVDTIHLSKTPPPNVEAFALSKLSTFCHRVTQGLEVPLDTSIFVGDVNLLPSGDDRLLHLRLIVVPWAGPFVKPSTKELLARQDDELMIVCLVVTCCRSGITPRCPSSPSTTTPPPPRRWRSAYFWPQPSRSGKSRGSLLRPHKDPHDSI